MVNFDYNEFILNGFYKTTYEDIDTIPISKIEFDLADGSGVSYPSSVPQEFLSSIDMFKAHVDMELRKTFRTVEFRNRTTNKYGVWDGTESSSTIWHNDYREGGTMLVLLYFDLMPQDGSCGGRFSVTHNDGNFDCYAPRTNEVHELIPELGDVIFITHDRNIDHKVQVTTINPRRVMSLGLDCQF